MTKQTIKRYFIFQEGDDILLVINAPVDDFDDGTFTEIMDEARARGFEDAIDADYQKYFQTADQGDVIRIGGYKSKGKEGEDDNGAAVDTVDASLDAIEIRIAENNMSAMLTVNDDSIKLTEELIRAHIEEAGIVHGIIEENIQRIIDLFPEVTDLKIARGEYPVAGTDATVELLQDIKTDLTPETTHSGRADFKKLNLISPVHVGDVIKLRTPPTDGEPGMDIFGKKIPTRKGRDLRLLKGVNAKISEDGCSLVAQEDGFLYHGPGGTVNVMAVYIVNGDVDYHTGNIEYKGDIIVKGDVRSGFGLKSGRNIVIRGSVEDCEIHAKGTVQINGGVRSSGVSLIVAGGDIRVNFLENTHVETPGNVFINREAVNCEIRAGGDIEVQWNKGRILGGHVSAGGWIIAPTLGSEFSSLAELAVEPEGWEPHFKKLKKINAEITAICNDASIDDEERAVILKRFIDRRVEISKILNEMFAYSFISAKSYPSPVNVLFGYDVYKVTEDTGITTFTFRDLEIKHDREFLDLPRREELRKEREKANPEHETANAAKGVVPMDALADYELVED